MLINLTPKRTRYKSAAPHHFSMLSGRTLVARRDQLTKQIESINKMLACTTCPKARGSLNSSKNMLMGTLSFIDGQMARLR